MEIRRVLFDHAPEKWGEGGSGAQKLTTEVSLLQQVSQQKSRCYIKFRIPFNRILWSSPYTVLLLEVWHIQLSNRGRIFLYLEPPSCDHISRRKIRHGWDSVECSSVWRCEAHWRHWSSCKQAAIRWVGLGSMSARLLLQAPRLCWLTLCSRVCT